MAAPGSTRASDRVGVGAFLGGFVIGGSGITVMLFEDAESISTYVSVWALGTYFWIGLGVPAAAIAYLTWMGRRWARRLLAMASVAASAGAAWELSNEQFEMRGVLATSAVAALFGLAFAAVLRGADLERRRRECSER